MSEVWVTIIALIAVTVAIKGIGPAVVGGRALPPALGRVIALLAPALLAALIVTGTFGAGERSLAVDARAAGLAVAAAVLALTNSLIGSVLAAAGATALLRALS